MNQTQIKILSYIGKHPGCSRGVMVIGTNLAWREMLKAWNTCVSKGWVTYSKEPYQAVFKRVDIALTLEGFVALSRVVS